MKRLIAVALLLGCIGVWGVGSVEAAPKKRGATKKEVSKPKAFTIETLYHEIAEEINKVKNDPFDNSGPERQKKDIYDKYSEKEFIIPESGNTTSAYYTQHLWPFTYYDGKLKLSLYRYMDQSTLSGEGQLYERPYNFIKSYYYDGYGGGKISNDGTHCSSYSRIDGYGISQINKPVSVNYISNNDNWSADTESYSYEYYIKMDADEARHLSGNIITYVKLKNIKDSYLSEISNGGFTLYHKYKSCYAGSARIINGDIDTIRFVNKASGSEILRLIFKY